MYQENNGFLEEVFDMRKILKIIVAPFVLVLILAVAVISFLSCIAGACCGLPAIGGWLLDRLYGMKYALQDFMFS